MFDIQSPARQPNTTALDPPPALDPRSGPDPAGDLDPGLDSSGGVVPLERVEAQICELAGHLAAATCRFLVLVGDFDARRGWAEWEMGSCAQWMSWKCQMSSGTAREHVRVARALRVLPVIRAERFARAHRQVSRADDDAARLGRRLSWRVEEDGSLAGAFRLPPLAGAVLLQALRAAAGYLDPRPHDHDGAGSGVPAETPAGGGSGEVTSSNLADALLVLAEAFLAAKVTAASDPEIYQVIVHVGTGALPPDTPPGSQPDVPAETPAVPAETPAGPGIPGHPADPARCHVQDGPAVSVSTAQMLTCTAALSWLLHDRDGTALDTGRHRRRPATAQRRAARDRDHGRCQFPGCESRRIDLHHIQYRAHGGPTTVENLLSLCRHHHTLIHDRGYLITAPAGGTVTFRHPCPEARPCPNLTAPSPTGTTPRSPPTPSSRPGTANASTWTTPSTHVSLTPKTKPASNTTSQNTTSRTRTAPGRPSRSNR